MEKNKKMKNIFAKKNNKNENHHFGGETSKIGILVFVGLFILFFISAPTTTSASAVKSVGKTGLVGYWPMNDGAGTSANDLSGNRINGTLFNGPLWVAGKIGKALSFDGIDDYARMSSVPLGDLQKVSISYWLKVPASTGAAMISMELSADSNANPNGSFWQLIYGNGSVYSSSLAATALYGTGPVYNLRTYPMPSVGWHHFVFVYDRSKASNQVDAVYIDGVSQTLTSTISSMVAGTTFRTDNMYLMSRGGVSYRTSGYMDDLRIYSRILSESEVKNIYQFGSAQIKAVGNSGLVGYWPLNDGAGTKANDMSGKGNIGTISGTPSWVNGRFNKALSFDGSTNYIQAGPTPALTKNGTYTFSAWLKSSTIGTQTIFQSSPSCIDRNGAALSGNTLLFGYYNGTAWVGASGSVPANQYFHFVGVNNGGTLSLYINGVLQVGTSVPYVHCADGNLYLGQETYPGDPTKFAGIMDDVRVYSRVLSASEILQLYKQNATQINSSRNDFLTNGLVGLWSFDGKDVNWGTNKVLDRSGQGNDGTFVGMSTTSSPTNGKIGQALKFRGISSGSYVTLGTSTTLNPANFTISAWLYPATTTVSYGYIYSSARDCCGAYNGIDLQYTNGRVTGGIWNSTAAYVTSAYQGIDIKWRHVAFSYDGAVLRVYVDGLLSNSANSTLGVGSPATYPAAIGGMGLSPGTYTFNGKIDDVRLYNRALSATEIKQLYNLAR